MKHFLYFVLICIISAIFFDKFELWKALYFYYAGVFIDTILEDKEN